MKAVLALLVLLAASSWCLTNESFAVISENEEFLLEGSGFAVTEKVIKSSEVDIYLSSQDQRGSSINLVTENGFVTLDDEEFIITQLEGKFLREGKYIRINGEVESSNGFDTSISFFGRLIAESKDASIYGFTGRITTSDETYKITYTTKLSTLSKTNYVPADTTSDDFLIHILEYSSTKGISDSIVPGQKFSDSFGLRFFSHDRISIDPGSTITIRNDDQVSHSIISGKENYGDRYNPFTPDGRISTGAIEPGKSVSITFDEAGFYRLYDPDYTWMKIVAYVFPDSDSLTLGEGQHAGN